jgi:acetyltransferase-like isoleucine patch superfamily enzyme
MRLIKKLIFYIYRIFCTFYSKKKIGSYGVNFTVNFFSFFTKNTHVGNNCHFNGIKIRGSGSCFIGDYFHSGDEILILTQNHNYKNPKLLPYDDEYISRDVSIGKYVWFGSRVIVLPGTVLGDGCIVQAGAVVSGHFPSNAIIGGNPAKAFATRDEAIVQRLVKEGRFLL